MDNGCIFCRIVANELPSARVYEDELALAFLDINPVSKGHTLVIPKSHYPSLPETPDEVLAGVMRVVRKVAIAQMKGLNVSSLNVTQANGALAGQVVPHLHFHVIPRYESARDARNWTPGSYTDQAEMVSYAEKIRRGLDAARQL